MFIWCIYKISLVSVPNHLKITCSKNFFLQLAMFIQTNPVNRIAHLQSFFMHLTRICHYPCQRNIHKFTAHSTSVHMRAI